MVIESLELSQISIVGPVRRIMNTGTLPARKAQCVYCTEKVSTFFGSPYPQLPFDIIIALVHTRYRGDQKPPTFTNLHCRPYSAVYEPEYFARPYSPVRLLHRKGDYIFWFSMPPTTF